MIAAGFVDGAGFFVISVSVQEVCEALNVADDARGVFVFADGVPCQTQPSAGRPRHDTVVICEPREDGEQRVIGRARVGDELAVLIGDDEFAERRDAEGVRRVVRAVRRDAEGCVEVCG